MRHYALVTAVSVILLCSSARPVAATESLIYTPLNQPCRLLDTRSPGPGAFTAANGTYLLGTSDTDIQSASQNGNGSGCAIPAGIYAISANFNMFNATAAGNIFAWPSGTSKPAAGTAIYNPSISSPSPGQLTYNTGFATIVVGTSDGRFNFAVANGQIDMTINVVGYWKSISTASTVTGSRAVSIGSDNLASANYAIAGGFGNSAKAESSMTLGSNNTAYGSSGVALGAGNAADGTGSLAAGVVNTTAATGAIALGYDNIADGYASVALGLDADTNGHAHSFNFSDGTAVTLNNADNQFMVRAKGGFVFYTSSYAQGTAQSTGAYLSPGSGSWGVLSDRNAKDAVLPIDGRVVLDRVAAMPLATWHYKAQDPKYRHMGPMAQDFYAAFGLGESSTGIDTVDADGVALAAIQGLNDKLKTELEQRDRQIAKLEADNAQMRASVAALAAAIGHSAMDSASR